jgi:putative inorganic carbon (HCO3(-)) transporter
MTETRASFSSAGSTRLESIVFGLFAAFVASLQLSIAAANILLALTFLGWLALLVREHRRPSAPAFFIALLAYAAATLVSSAFSLDPRESFIDDRQLLLFTIVPLTYDLAARGRASTITLVLVTIGALSAAVGIVQYTLLHYDSLHHRPQGTLGHYMTYSGQLMLIICVAAAAILLERRNRAWPALVMPALIVALVLTFTRNAWVGTMVAAALLLVMRDFRMVAVLPIVVAVVFALAPDRITARMTSMFDLRDPTNRDRVAMLHSGVAIVRDHPLTGVGPNMIPRVYVQYRDPNAENATNPHLHNVPLQIAAERGLLALAVWLWFIVATVAGLVALIRRNQSRTLACAALAATVAMLAAGLFEHNFGDSEFVMLFLVIITLPFAAARQTA